MLEIGGGRKTSAGAYSPSQRKSFYDRAYILHTGIGREKELTPGKVIGEFLNRDRFCESTDRYGFLTEPVPTGIPAKVSYLFLARLAFMNQSLSPMNDCFALCWDS